jgi:hypothetical protein
MSIDLVAGIVYILDFNRQTTGTGFVVTDDGLIATCAHGVEAAGAESGKAVRIVFHATGEAGQATVEPD